VVKDWALPDLKPSFILSGMEALIEFVENAEEV
jgi:hypothetical protein